jgi:uncharacterized protein (DUF1684 family)
LALLDWRRSVSALYAAVRSTADPAAAHELWCGGRQRLFAEHPESPDRGAVLQVAPYDAAFRFECEVLPAPPERIEIPTATDGVVSFQRIGRVELAGCGELDVWWLDSYGGGVWLPIRAPGQGTYPGGRYVLDTVKGADLGGDVDAASGRGRLVVDLNFAYNPSCAYDEAWACPLPPAGNAVAEPVGVGELLPVGDGDGAAGDATFGGGT